MEVPRAFSTTRLIVTAVIACGVVAGTVILFMFDPATAGIYPVCTFHQMTGLQCPGCGGLRAMHQLSHGHLAAAWHLNPLLMVLLPVALWLGVREAARVFAHREWPGLVTRPIFGYLLAGALILFGILRNLPYHFSH
jgi:hypothetical protein